MLTFILKVLESACTGSLGPGNSLKLIMNSESD